MLTTLYHQAKWTQKVHISIYCYFSLLYLLLCSAHTCSYWYWKSKEQGGTKKALRVVDQDSLALERLIFVFLLILSKPRQRREPGCSGKCKNRGLRNEAILEVVGWIRSKQQGTQSCAGSINIHFFSKKGTIYFTQHTQDEMLKSSFSQKGGGGSSKSFLALAKENLHYLAHLWV